MTHWAESSPTTATEGESPPPQPPALEGQQRSMPTSFLAKTYQLVDDPSIDDIISWNDDGSTFVVCRPRMACATKFSAIASHALSTRRISSSTSSLATEVPSSPLDLADTRRLFASVPTSSLVRSLAAHSARVCGVGLPSNAGRVSPPKDGGFHHRKEAEFRKWECSTGFTATRGVGG